MKVKVEFTLDVDVDAWMTEYGLRTTYEVRKDVRTYVQSAAYEGLSGLGLLVEPAAQVAP